MRRFAVTFLHGFALIAVGLAGCGSSQSSGTSSTSSRRQRVRARASLSGQHHSVRGRRR